MDREYLENAKYEIRKWEASGPGFIASVGDAILWPAQRAAEILIPQGVQEAVGKAIVAFLSKLSAAAEWTINGSEVQGQVEASRLKHNDELMAADEVAKSYWNWSVGYGIAEGGATGSAGLLGLAADIPALFSISLRCIQQIGRCYGYDTASESEKEYVMQILRTGSTGDLKTKVEFLISLKEVEQILVKVTWKKMNASLANREMSKFSVLAALRQFAESLGIQLTKRKALQMVPIVGALIGGAFNGTFVNDVAGAAYMSYRRRYMSEREAGEEGGGALALKTPPDAGAPGHNA